MKKGLLRSMLMFLLALVGFYVFMLVFLFFAQRGLIYFPRSYDNIHRSMIAQVGEEIVFHTSDGKQEMFYIPARSAGGESALPEKIWICFGGNASLALDWLEMVESYPDEDTAFVLVDYPGYGWSEGRPSRDSIIRTAEAIVPALAEHLDVERAEFEGRLNLFGHSMGAAAALELAVREPINGIVLVSPYTSLSDMARSIPTFRPFYFVVRDRFDNKARLGELMKHRAGEVCLSLLHGEHDEIIPSRMSEELAELWGEGARLSMLTGGDHNWILGSHRNDIFGAMMGTCEE